MFSFDAMGGDKGPKVVIDGIAKSLEKYPDTNFIIHGQKSQLSSLIESHPEISAQCKIVQCEDIVTMEEKPSNVIRTAHAQVCGQQLKQSEISKHL